MSTERIMDSCFLAGFAEASAQTLRRRFRWIRLPSSRSSAPVTRQNSGVRRAERSRRLPNRERIHTTARCNMSYAPTVPPRAMSSTTRLRPNSLRGDAPLASSIRIPHCSSGVEQLGGRSRRTNYSSSAPTTSSANGCRIKFSLPTLLRLHRPLQRRKRTATTSHWRRHLSKQMTHTCFWARWTIRSTTAIISVDATTTVTTRDSMQRQWELLLLPLLATHYQITEQKSITPGPELVS